MKNYMEKKDRYISIGEMAKINRTTVPTLRLYDSMGLLTPYYTDEETHCYVDEQTHYRYYDIKQNARFDMIQYMKELGMELKEIKELFDKQDINLIEQILRQKKEQTVAQMQELKFKMQ
ncbi:MAG TPA: MerR family transcriptional regulator, partial [Lachnospira sp.]|nr:MerR family transcriptional regulator [Lachnospira sp.]